jgi:hypothetical protein
VGIQRVWGERYDGRVATVMVWPGSVPVLAGLLDPAAPWVYVESHAPMDTFGGDAGWTAMRVPLTPGRLQTPDLVQARHLRCDLLLRTARFLEIAPELGNVSATVMQLRRRPDDRVRLDSAHPQALAAWYHASGLVIGFRLPHTGEQTQLLALDQPSLAAALARLPLDDHA